MANNNSDLSPAEISTKIEELRAKFLEKFTDIADNRDVQRIKQDDIWLKQFLYVRKYNIEHALTLMETTLKWRKEIEINDISEQNLSEEVLSKGSIYFHSCDKDNHDILYLRVKDNKKDPELCRQVKRYLAYLLEEHHTKQKEERIVVLMDATDMGLSNVDMDLLRFEITCFTTYFPCLLEYMLIHEMPWLANAIWKVVKTWLSAEQQKRVLFCKKGDIQEYINKDKLWVHMGGTDNFEYKYTPKSHLTNGDSETPSAIEQSVEGQVSEGLTRSSSWPSQADQQTSTKKHVTFNESSLLNTSSRTPTAPRGLAPPFLQTSCTGDINFPVASGTESRYVLTLTNSRSKPVAFKVKTTTPAGYRVRPGSDTVQPGTSSVVEIVCLPAHQDKCSKDRFLLMAAEVESEEFDMRNVPSEKLYTNRYNVTYGQSESAVSVDAGTKSGGSSDIAQLARKVDQLFDQQKRHEADLAKLQTTVNLVLYIVVALLALTCLYVMFMYLTGSSASVGDTCVSSPAAKYEKSVS